MPPLATCRRSSKLGGPTCRKPLSEKQVLRGAVVCSNCERTGHHLCAGCHEPLSEEEISEGAELCSNCGLEETGTAMIYDLGE